MAKYILNKKKIVDIKWWEKIAVEAIRNQVRFANETYTSLSLEDIAEAAESEWNDQVSLYLTVTYPVRVGFIHFYIDGDKVCVRSTRVLATATPKKAKQ